MKRALSVLTGLILVIILLSPTLLGFSVFHLGHALEVATSLSAKLACSSKFISGFDDKQVVKDLSSYSPATNLVTIRYDQVNKSVTTSLFGLAETGAQYREGVGCSLLTEQASMIKGVQLKKLAPLALSWPYGNDVANNAPLVQQKVEQMLRSDNERGYNTRALLVVKDGVLLAEAYGPNVTKQTPLLGWSMAKSVTAILLGILEQQGQLNREQSGLFSEWLGDRRKEITIEQLMQMNSGLIFDETYAPGSDATHMLFTASSASDVALKSSLGAEPGTTFSYSSGTTNLLSRYISKLFDNDPQRVQEFVKNQLFKPLGMTNSEFEMDASGVLVGSSYLYASGRDWARLGWLMVNNGKIGNKQVLAEEWINAAQTPNLSDNDKKYGYQFWLNSGEQALRWSTLPKDAYAMMGNRKQSVMMIPSENIVFVRLGWTKGDYPMESNYRGLLELLN